MALLRSRRRVVLVVLGLLAVTGCVLMQLDAPAVGFSHRIHEEVGLSCGDCHEAGETGEPLLPAPDLCLMCHEDIDADKPPGQHATDVLAQFPPRWRALSDEVLFSHAAHEAGGAACERCHAGVAQSDALVPGRFTRFTMADCTSCHAQSGVADSCSTCHTQLDVDVAPATHGHNWMRRHGQIVRADGGATVDDCNLCHTEQSCIGCHRDEPPSSHTNAFRLRTHGVMAAMDRDACSTCHTPDSCNRCHSEVLPLSHRGSFGSPRNTHCLTCHFPVGTQSCVVCHRSTPSHQLATPLPADHSPGLDCRQCHGVQVKLPHVDNGSDCIFCHK